MCSYIKKNLKLLLLKNCNGFMPEWAHKLISTIISKFNMAEFTCRAVKFL